MTTRTFLPNTSLIAGAVFACLTAAAGTASAQSSVTIYGRIDLGVQYSNKTAGSNSRLVEQSNGGIRPSVLGFKGTEDLGGGLKASFALEHHLSADTGQAFPRFWRRQANVSLSGGFGTVTLGRMYSPALLELLPTEPRAFKENFSGLYPYAFNQNSAGNSVQDLGIFLGNAVSYSNAFGPVSFGAAVAAGEGVGGRTYSAGLSYKGPLTFSLAYQKIGAVPNGGTRMTGAGVAAPLGSFTIKAQYLRFDEDAARVRIAETTSFGIGADFAWNPVNTFNISYYDVKNKRRANDETKTFVISNDYAMSKRTTLYVQAAFADPGNGATLRTTVIANGSRPGSNTSAYNVGISHNF